MDTPSLEGQTGQDSKQPALMKGVPDMVQAWNEIIHTDPSSSNHLVTLLGFSGGR